MSRILMMIKTLPALLLLFAIFCSSPQIVWQRVLDTGTNEQVAGLILCCDNLIVIGNQGSEETGRCVWLIQTLDLNGNLLRRQTFAEGKMNILCAGCTFRDKNILLCGYARPYDTTLCLIIKVARDGRTLWKKGLALGRAS